jgi:fructosamine-3-kinase
MSTTEDVSWQELRRIAREWLGESAELAFVKPLVGGCINTTLLLEVTRGDKAVIKISPHRVNRDYAREACQLKLLRDMGLPAPQVYTCRIGDLDHPFSYLLMEHMPGIDLAEAKKVATPAEYDKIQERLAGMVAGLHDNIGPAYQRILPNSDARTFENWSEFYRHVYDEIWREAERMNLLPPKARKQIGKVHERLDRLIAHADKPRLVHWDIWATNILARPDESGEWQITALLDPNCKYAHTEAEIAYMELFHTITPAFTKAYQARHKLHPDYHRFRRPIYQLYPLINHLRLFGQDYVKPLLSVLEKVAVLL